MLGLVGGEGIRRGMWKGSDARLLTGKVCFFNHVPVKESCGRARLQARSSVQRCGCNRGNPWVIAISLPSEF